MFLVDTSVWIDYLNDTITPATRYFESILNENIPYGICGMIYQEVLQGAASERDYRYLADYLSTQTFFEPKDTLLTYQKAAHLYFNCRKKGITIRSSIDCLIAQLSLEHGLILLHNDKDYLHIQKIIPKLRLATQNTELSYQN